MNALACTHSHTHTDVYKRQTLHIARIGLGYHPPLIPAGVLPYSSTGALLLPPPDTRYLETTAVALWIGDREVGLISAYLPPGPGGPPPPEEWDALLDHEPVSYTHLDVYKRQGVKCETAKYKLN